MVELKGSLSGIGLPAIVQLISELHHTGTLHLVRGESSGILSFDDGRLVAAECGMQQGLQALAACALNFADADFTFVESPPILNGTLDLSPADLKRVLSRVQRGEFPDIDDVTLPALEAPEQVQTCPLLGFADDRNRHYSRPTALHRCYAARSPSLVTSQEQRDLCLAGRFAACPRYRNAEPLQLVPPVVNEPPRREPEKPAIPPAVASGVVAASQMRLAAPPEQDVPTWIGHAPVAPQEPSPAAALPPEPILSRLPRRGVLFVASGAVLGLVIVTLALVVLLPSLNSGLTQKPSTVAAPAFESVPATRPPAPLVKPTTVPVIETKPTTVPVIETKPTPASGPQAAPTGGPASLPTAVPTPTPPPPATPTTPPRPTVAVAGGQSLMDVRFSTGPAERWLDNPPFGAWRDGAYRLQANQAARFVAIGVPIKRVLSDVVVSGTFRKTGGPPGGGYGLIVRDQGPEPRDGVNQEANAYVFETGDLGEFGVWRRDGDHWVDLVPWTHVASVRPGGSPNELRVRAINDSFTFTVNGEQVALVQDSQLVAGGIGIFVGGDYNEVAVDRFSVQLPE